MFSNKLLIFFFFIFDVDYKYNCQSVCAKDIDFYGSDGHGLFISKPYITIAHIDFFTACSFKNALSLLVNERFVFQKYIASGIACFLLQAIRQRTNANRNIFFIRAQR